MFWGPSTGMFGPLNPGDVAPPLPPSDPLAALPGPSTSQSRRSRPEKPTSATGAECFVKNKSQKSQPLPLLEGLTEISGPVKPGGAATTSPPPGPLAALPGPGTSQSRRSRPETPTSATGAECFGKNKSLPSQPLPLLDAFYSGISVRQSRVMWRHHCTF